MLEETGLPLSGRKVLPRNPSLGFSNAPSRPRPHASLLRRTDAAFGLGAMPHLFFPVQGSSVYLDSVSLSLEAMMLCPLRNRFI